MAELHAPAPGLTDPLKSFHVCQQGNRERLANDVIQRPRYPMHFPVTPIDPRTQTFRCGRCGRDVPEREYRLVGPNGYDGSCTNDYPQATLIQAEAFALAARA